MTHKTYMISTPLAFVWNMALAYVVYWLCRLIYWAENVGAFQGFWSHNTLRDIFTGAWMFDTSAILYTNVLYALLMLIPLPWKECSGWQRVAKWLFVIVNGLAVCINLCDAAYFPYTGRRTTTTVFQEFSNEGNLGGIFAVELLRHWYLVLAAVVLIALLWKGYKIPTRPTPLPLPCREGSSHHLSFCSPPYKGGARGWVRWVCSCLLHHPSPYLCSLYPADGHWYARRSHHGRAAHHYLQRQPVCGASG